MRKKVLLLGCTILYTIVYCFVYFFNYFNSPSSDTDQSLPDVAASSNLLDYGKDDSEGNTGRTLLEKRIKVLPEAAAAKLVVGSNTEESNLMKLRKTPFSYPEDMETIDERISREDIMKAPIVYVIPMSTKFTKYELVVVEKDGKLYDASDGVRVYTPRF